jgi:hypothetical protein
MQATGKFPRSNLSYAVVVAAEEGL